MRVNMTIPLRCTLTSTSEAICKPWNTVDKVVKDLYSFKSTVDIRRSH